MASLPIVETRDVRPDEHTTAARVLTAAFHDSVVLRWAEPDLAARTRLLRPYFTGLLTHAAAHSSIRVADSDGVLAAVAVWFPHPLPAGVTDVHDLAPPDTPPTDAALRLGMLEKALQALHPDTDHQYLAYLGVHPTEQNHGLGSLLLRERLADLRRAGTPAYLVANDPRNRRLYGRNGFTDHGPAVTVDDSPPMFPMSWHPTHRPFTS